MSSRPLSLAPPRLAAWPRDFSFFIRVAAFLEAVTELVRVDLCTLWGFSRLRAMIARTSVATATQDGDVLALVRVAVRDACVFYIRPVKCLQRSAVVTRMLRRRGLDARMVIGYQSVPQRWHAWVEIGPEIVWNQLYGLAHYRTVDRV